MVAKSTRFVAHLSAILQKWFGRLYENNKNDGDKVNALHKIFHFDAKPSSPQCRGHNLVYLLGMTALEISFSSTSFV